MLGFTGCCKSRVVFSQITATHLLLGVITPAAPTVGGGKGGFRGSQGLCKGRRDAWWLYVCVCVYPFQLATTGSAGSKNGPMWSLSFPNW